jgi:hypothetical protein
MSTFWTSFHTNASLIFASLFSFRSANAWYLSCLYIFEMARRSSSGHGEVSLFLTGVKKTEATFWAGSGKGGYITWPTPFLSLGEYPVSRGTRNFKTLHLCHVGASIGCNSLGVKFLVMTYANSASVGSCFSDLSDHKKRALKVHQVNNCLMNVAPLLSFKFSANLLTVLRIW